MQTSENCMWSIVGCVAAVMHKMASVEAVRCQQRRRRFTVYIFVSTAITLLVLTVYYKRSRLIGQDISPGSVVLQGPADEIFYGIIFDAGSTGSRIHAYKFRRNPFATGAGGVGDYQLLDELFEQTKPGLSFYAKDPPKAAESLRPMMEKAKKYVPESSWSDTVLALKATAGLRLLSDTVATNILNEVTNLLRSYPFKMAENGVSLLEGADEGLYSWFTVNFLQGLLSDSTGMTGVLDLGGGSTQITYVPFSTSTVAPSNNHSVNVHLFGRKHLLYARSYLGLGMNSGRFQALGGKESTDKLTAGSFNSTCLPDSYDGKWMHAGHEHRVRLASHRTSFGLHPHDDCSLCKQFKTSLVLKHIRADEVGDASKATRFESCYQAVKNVIDRYKMDKLQDVGRLPSFFAISYYYDKAADCMLIPKEAGGQIKVEQFISAAQTACDGVAVSNSTVDPFSCLDLCYISSLLVDGLGFDKTSSLTLKKKIKNVEIAWPLGAMFNVYKQFYKSPT